MMFKFDIKKKKKCLKEFVKICRKTKTDDDFEIYVGIGFRISFSI